MKVIIIIIIVIIMKSPIKAILGRRKGKVREKIKKGGKNQISLIKIFRELRFLLM